MERNMPMHKEVNIQMSSEVIQDVNGVTWRITEYLDGWRWVSEDDEGMEKESTQSFVTKEGHLYFQDFWRVMTSRILPYPIFYPQLPASVNEYYGRRRTMIIVKTAINGAFFVVHVRR